MKLLRYGDTGFELPGLLDSDGQIRSLKGIIPDLEGELLSDESIEKLQQLDVARLPIVEDGVRLAPCVCWHEQGYRHRAQLR